jgi:DNA-binding NtrC family response regulator
MNVPSRSERSRPTRLAIVFTMATQALADEVANLLLQARELEAERFCCESSSWAVSDVSFEPDVVIVTLGATDERQSLELFRELQNVFPDRPVIAIPNLPNGLDVSRILEMGAADFLLPPLRLAELLPRVSRLAAVAKPGDVPLEKLKEEIGLQQIVGESAALQREIRRIPRFAGCDPATVLICGDTGTGKEMFARAVHYLSPRKGKPFVPVNCGAIPEDLIESEIFGHKRGAFTGAIAEQFGLIREAEAGTLFLDEIDTLSCQAQVKLLRFLQEGEYRSVGSQRLMRANVRVIAAAHGNIEQLVQEGKFREDLFYRLNVLRFTLPVLRERREDIPLLACHILEEEAIRRNGRRKDLSLAALDRLASYSWPGNIRELQNVLIRAALLSDSNTIQASDLSLPTVERPEDEISFRARKSQVVRQFEYDFLKSVLRKYDNNITQAARAVQKNRRAFWELLRKHGLVGSALVPKELT